MRHQLLCPMMRASSCQSAFYEQWSEATSDLCPGAAAASKRPAEVLLLNNLCIDHATDAALFNGSAMA